MRTILIILLVGVGLDLFCQDKKKYAEDVSSISNISEAILNSISGPKGEKRDWTRFRNLFLPTAQLTAVFHNQDSSWIQINSLDKFIQLAGSWYEENGFREYSFKTKVEKFGNIAHVFQSYGVSLDDGKEIERGMNSFQLAFHQNRWWIVNVIWDSETKQHPLSKDYLK